VASEFEQAVRPLCLKFTDLKQKVLTRTIVLKRTIISYKILKRTDLSVFESGSALALTLFSGRKV